jgi:hypothetical protein
MKRLTTVPLEKEDYWTVVADPEIAVLVFP